MVLNNILLLIGSVLVAGSCWPGIKFGMEGPPDLMPENPRPIVSISLVILALYIAALIGAFFLASIDWWVPIICFFIAGPFGMNFGVRYIRRHGHFLTLLVLGLIGLASLILAYVV